MVLGFLLYSYFLSLSRFCPYSLSYAMFPTGLAMGEGDDFCFLPWRNALAPRSYGAGKHFHCSFPLHTSKEKALMLGVVRTCRVQSTPEKRQPSVLLCWQGREGRIYNGIALGVCYRPLVGFSLFLAVWDAKLPLGVAVVSRTLLELGTI